MRLQHTKEIR